MSCILRRADGWDGYLASFNSKNESVLKNMKRQIIAFQMIVSSDDCFHNYDSIPQLKFFHMKNINPPIRTSIIFKQHLQ